MNGSKYFVVLKNGFKSLKDGKQLKRLKDFIDAQPNSDELEIITKEERDARGDEIVDVVDCVYGQTVTISRSQLGTCCDPSTERYHSM